MKKVRIPAPDTQLKAFFVAEIDLYLHEMAKIQERIKEDQAGTAALRAEADATLDSVFQMLDAIKKKREEREGRADCD